MLLRTPHHTISFPRRPLVMGIVNINDDSFSGDGTLDHAAALALAGRMLRDGADIIDVGAESARTNRAPISAREESARLAPFLDAWPALAADTTLPRDGEQLHPPLLSINTWRTDVIASVLEHPAASVDLINDMSALPGAENAAICARHGAALLIMHSVGLPKQPHTAQHYPDLWNALESFFEEKIALAESAGLDRERIVLDPGIDFAKQRGDNLEIYRHLERLTRFDRPILMPVSRKTVIGDVLDIANPAERDPGTVACAVAGILRGAAILRVHNVPATVQTVRVIEALK